MLTEDERHAADGRLLARGREVTADLSRVRQLLREIGQQFLALGYVLCDHPERWHHDPVLSIEEIHRLTTELRALEHEAEQLRADRQQRGWPDA